MVSTSAPDVSPDTDGRYFVFNVFPLAANLNPDNIPASIPTPIAKPHLFQPGNPGGPGRPPSLIPTFFRAITECQDPEEIQRLIAQGMRNPVIAAKLRAIQSADEDLANKASEQLVDRVFGKARQTVEHAGEVNIHVSLLDKLRQTEADST